MRTFSNIARNISGLVFIFSAISKGVDPLGSMYKFIDYFTAFGLDSFNNLALFLGIALCTAEFIIGFAVLTGVRMKEAAWGLIIFMAGFTPLTLVLAISNPVSDCGCFGDAIHLTNWQTFFKNLIILLFVIPVFLKRSDYKALSTGKKEWISIVCMTVIFLLFVQWNYRYLPIIDFRPYSRGTDIENSMIIPDDAPVDEYEITLIYEKDGKQEEFTLENYPSDSSWVFVDQKSVLVKKGYAPPIHDFSLTSIYGDDMTDRVLNQEGYTILMVSTRLTDAPSGSIDRGIEMGLQADDAGLNFYILTSSSTDDLLSYNNNQFFLSGDETTLKTIVRSNPGFVLISNGVIIKKWSYVSVPDIETITEKLDEYENKKIMVNYQKVILLLVLVALISYLCRILVRKTKPNKL